MKEYSRGKHNPTIGMTPQEVTNYWVSKAIDKYGDKFDYSKVGIINNKKGSCIIVCHKHGQMKTSFYKHMGSNTGCAKCGDQQCRDSKMMSFEEFLDKLEEINPNRNFKILSRQFKERQIKYEKVYTQDEFGICKVGVKVLLRGSYPSIKTACFKNLYSERMYRKSIGYKGLHFNGTVYKKSLEYISVRCYSHGEYTTKPNWIISNNRGCPKCYEDRRHLSLRSNTKTFINKAIVRLGTSRDIYDKVQYINAKTKVEILCNKHNSYYFITPNDHLTGYGCPTCGVEQGGFSRTNYINTAKGRKANLYLIKCFKGDEVFYKIGISLHSLKRRYNKTNSIPYEYEEIIFEPFNAGDTWDLEKQILREFKQYKYSPLETFQGHTECFNLDLPVKEIEEKLAQLK